MVVGIGVLSVMGSGGQAPESGRAGDQGPGFPPGQNGPHVRPGLPDPEEQGRTYMWAWPTKCGIYRRAKHGQQDKGTGADGIVGEPE